MAWKVIVNFRHESLVVKGRTVFLHSKLMSCKLEEMKLRAEKEDGELQEEDEDKCGGHASSK